jgi:hypothetical protein
MVVRVLEQRERARRLHNCEPFPIVPCSSILRSHNCLDPRCAQLDRASHHPNWSISKLELVGPECLGAHTRVGSPALLAVRRFELWPMEEPMLGAMV